eukprot:21209-Heterococcus_DN1.PRE.2
MKDVHKVQKHNFALLADSIAKSELAREFLRKTYHGCLLYYCASIADKLYRTSFVRESMFVILVTALRRNLS